MIRRSLIVLIALTLPLASGIAHATVPGANGAIVFQRCQHGECRLWRVDPDGSSKVALTPANEDAFDPVWSPDGQRVAFVHELPSGAEALAILRVATGHQRRIFAVRPGENRGLFLPTWSPRGRRIALSRDSGGQRYEVLIINIRTGKVSIPTKDISGSQAQPDWGPTGQRIAFVSRGRTIGVLSIRSGLAHRVVAANGVGFPSWKPDGARIAFSAIPAGGTASQIMTVARDGTGLTRMTHGGLLKLAPSFAPDGTHIAFWGLNNDTGRSRIYVMDADGSHVQRLTAGPGFEALPDWQPLP